MSNNNLYHNSDDWKMFWIIEEKNLEKLHKLCVELKKEKKNILVYFNINETIHSQNMHANSEEGLLAFDETSIIKPKVKSPCDLTFCETKNIFTQDEIDKINVHVFDVINFSPIQHTHYLNWYDGTKCLKSHNIGVGYKYGMTISRFKK